VSIEPGAGQSEIFGKDFGDAAKTLVQRIVELRNQTSLIEADKWEREFVAKCEEVKTTLAEEWNREWVKKCNGKRLIQDLYRQYEIAMDQLTFKKRVIRQMQIEASESWRVIESTIRNELQ
jgi:hypothetical protein